MPCGSTPSADCPIGRIGFAPLDFFVETAPVLEYRVAPFSLERIGKPDERCTQPADDLQRIDSVPANFVEGKRKIVAPLTGWVDDERLSVRAANVPGFAFLTQAHHQIENLVERLDRRRRVVHRGR